MQDQPSNQQEYDALMAQGYEDSSKSGEASDPNSLYADTMREEKIRNVISQINPDNLMVDIEYRLRGFRKNQFTNQWEKSSGSKEVSEELLSNFTSFLGSILTQNTSLSNFSADEINNIMSMIITYIRDDLADNEDKYGITGDYHEMTRIANILCMTVFSTLKQAQNGMLVKRVFSALKINEALNQQKPKGALSDFKFW